MANTIILKRSSTPGKVPTTAQLEFGEIAINTYDGKVFIKKDDGTPAVIEVGAVQSVNGYSGTVTIDTDDVSEGSNQYFTTARARSSVSAGTGISYNSSTGVISASQNIATSASPTFAGLTLTGNMGITGNIIPSADVTYDLGSPSYQWKDIYVGPGSLYVNGQKVLQDDSGTITFTADVDENIRIKTLGTGVLQLGSSTTNVNVDGTLQIASGKNITDSAGAQVNFGDNIQMNNNKVVGLGAPSASTDAATKGYVDTQVGAISTSSIAQGNSNVTVTDTGTGTVTVSVDGSTALTVTSSGVVVAGNFTVQGATTTVEANTINLADNIITLNSDTTGSATQNAGVEVERGDDTNVALRWNEGSDVWQFTNDGATYYPMASSTDVLAEGSTNQYFTNTRARSALSASSATGISYNSGTGAFSLGSIPNSSLTNNSITINGTAVALGGSRTLDTDAVSEGATNKYFSNTLARGAVSAGTGISYNSTTGVISTSAIPNASLANSSVTVGTTAISLGSSSTTLAGLTSVTSTGFTGALTGNASTATTLQTARTINGVSFDGSANVTVHTAGTGISISGTTVTNTDLGSSQNIFKNFTDGTTTAAADSNNDTFKFRGSAGVTVAVASDDATHGDSLLVSLSSVPNSSLANSSITINGTAISLGSSGSINTSAISESGNLYYTDARARAALSFTAGSGAYNSTTGVITIPTNTNQLTNGAGFVTSSGVTSVSGTAPIVSSGGATPAISISAATTTAAGSMSATDKAKLDGIAAGATANTGTVTSVATGNGLTGGTITGTGTLSMSGSYTGTFTVTGDIRATGEVTAYYSDGRLKTNLQKIDGALDKVMALNGYTYDSNELAEELGLKAHFDQIGLLAQEVEAVMPQLVTDSALEGYKTIRYDKVVSVLVNAMKEQQAQIEELQALVKKTLH